MPRRGIPADSDARVVEGLVAVARSLECEPVDADRAREVLSHT